MVFKRISHTKIFGYKLYIGNGSRHYSNKKSTLTRAKVLAGNAKSYQLLHYSKILPNWRASNLIASQFSRKSELFGRLSTKYADYVYSHIYFPISSG
ncbi:MAG: hypothetical protein ACI9Y1_003667 [Lentisphaeria bacterium]|jgi:hypothetical protein